jgi:hypothetical protein
MLTDAAYIAALLHRSGQWDAALAVLPAEPTPQRAQILVDRFWWRQEGGDEAEAAVEALGSRYLGAQMAYARLLFEMDPREDDRQAAEAGFADAADDPELAGWGAFWLGVYADNVLTDRALAKAHYDKALNLCAGDLFLESYVVRHLGDHAMETDRAEGERLLRRSLHLRAALGARAHVAAAQATLADELAGGTEREILREAALAAATELRIPWLIAALTGM